MNFNITRQTVCTNHICINGNYEHTLEFDVNMPDYCDGIQRVLRFEATPYVSGKTVNGRNLSIEGNVCFSIIYCDDCGRVHTYRHIAPYIKNIDFSDEVSDCNLTVQPKCSYLKAKAVSSHKVEVQNVIALCVKGFCCKKTDIICEIESDNIFYNRAEKYSDSPVNFAEKNIVFEEELSIGASQPAVCDIIRYDLRPVVLSHKIVNERVVVKGELCVDVLYSADNCSITEKFSTTVPFSQIVDVLGLSDNCSCDVSAYTVFADIKPRSSFDGDAHSFLLNAKVCIKIDAMCHEEIPIIFDAYSSKCDLDIKYENVTSANIVDNLREHYLCEKDIEFTDGEMCEIVDLWCSANVLGSRIEENNIIITGVVNICMLCKNHEDELNFFERPFDFEYRYPTHSLSQNIMCEPQVSVVNCLHSFSGDNRLNLRVELDISAPLVEINNYNAITDLNVVNSKSDNKNEFSLIIYFACRGESVWDIAKSYKSSPEEIIKINGVDSVLAEDKALLIPIL